MLKVRTLMWCLEVPAESFVCSVSLSQGVFVFIPAAFPLDGSVFRTFDVVIRALSISCFYSQEALFPEISKQLLSDLSCLIQVVMKLLDALSHLIGGSKLYLRNFNFAILRYIFLSNYKFYSNDNHYTCSHWFLDLPIKKVFRKIIKYSFTTILL